MMVGVADYAAIRIIAVKSQQLRPSQRDRSLADSVRVFELLSGQLTRFGVLLPAIVILHHPSRLFPCSVGHLS
jgi:hypothetical protein